MDNLIVVTWITSTANQIPQFKIGWPFFLELHGDHSFLTWPTFINLFGITLFPEDKIDCQRTLVPSVVMVQIWT